MNNNQQLNKALIALAAIGIGIAAFAALSAWEQKRRFKEALQVALAENRITLVSADLARGSSNSPTWHVTIVHPLSGTQRYYVDFPLGIDPYSITTLNDLIERLLSTILGTGRQQ